MDEKIIKIAETREANRVEKERVGARGAREKG
jgi:hypothetical protein